MKTWEDLTGTTNLLKFLQKEGFVLQEINGCRMTYKQGKTLVDVYPDEI